MKALDGCFNTEKNAMTALDGGSALLHGLGAEWYKKVYGRFLRVLHTLSCMHSFRRTGCEGFIA